jgi:hypothetical protein
VEKYAYSITCNIGVLAKVLLAKPTGVSVKKDIIDINTTMRKKTQDGKLK